eukprot:1737837-Rhodomonas_salina.1
MPSTAHHVQIKDALNGPPASNSTPSHITSLPLFCAAQEISEQGGRGKMGMAAREGKASACAPQHTLSVCVSFGPHPPTPKVQARTLSAPAHAHPSSVKRQGES